MSDDPTPFGELIQDTVDLVEAPRLRAEVIRTRYDEDREEIDEAIRAVVMRRDRYRCTWCGDRRGLQLDHIIPWSAGGPDTIENLRVLCCECNTRRSNFVSPLDKAETLPHGIACLRCDPEECEYQNLTVIYCLNCKSRARGVDSRSTQGPGEFGVRFHQ